MTDSGWASRGRSRVRQRGFTLLEMMAVVVIIAITVSFASLSLSSRAADERLTNEAQRLQQLLKLASEEAVVQGQELGLLVADDGYRFYHLDNNVWTPYQEGPMRERRLPSGMRLLFSQDTRDQFKLPTTAMDEKAKKNKKDVVPQILLLSSGELTPFILELHADHYPSYFRAEGKIIGTVEMKRVTPGQT